MLPDTSTWLDDLSVHVKDDEVRRKAAEIEQTMAFAGSKLLAAGWLVLLGTGAGVFGAISMSPAVRNSTAMFLGYIAGAVVVLRLVYPLTKRLFGGAMAWAAALAMFWTFLLGASAVLGARLDSPFWAYTAAVLLGGFIGLMCGSLCPSTVATQELYLAASLLIAPLTTTAGTYVARTLSPDTDLFAATMAGLTATGTFSLATTAALATMWRPVNGMTKLGLLYLHNEHFLPQAVTQLSRAIELRPNDAQLYNLRAIAYSKMKEDALAAADYATTTSLSPARADVAMNRGLAHLERDEYDLAIAAIKQALEIDPKTEKAHSNLGVAYERRGDLDLAIQHYDEAIRQSPRHANAYSNRSYALHRKGEHQRALDDADRALQLKPMLGPAMVNRGHALRGLGRIDEAIAAFEEALEIGADATFHEEASRALDELRREHPGDDDDEE